MKPDTLLVRATSPDRPVPMIRTRIKPNKRTGRDDTMIYHDTPVQVDNVSFYRRAILRGDLLIVKAEPPKRSVIKKAEV